VTGTVPRYVIESVAGKPAGPLASLEPVTEFQARHVSQDSPYYETIVHPSPGHRRGRRSKGHGQTSYRRSGH